MSVQISFIMCYFFISLISGVHFLLQNSIAKIELSALKYVEIVGKYT